jgi:hypothetical protein
VLVLPRRDIISAQVSILDNLEWKLWVKDSRLRNIRFNALVFSLLALHHRHHKEIVMNKILVLWDRATVVDRLGTMLIDVPGSRQIRLQHRAQIQTSTVMQQQCNHSGKAESSSCSREPCGSGRCSSSSRHHHWYDPCQ